MGSNIKKKKKKKKRKKKKKKEKVVFACWNDCDMLKDVKVKHFVMVWQGKWKKLPQSGLHATHF